MSHERGKRSENEFSSSECNTETESPVADTSDLSGSTSISDQPKRILFPPGIREQWRLMTDARLSQPSSTPSPHPSLSEGRLGGSINAENVPSIYAQVSPSVTKSQVKVTTAQTSWGTPPVVKHTTADTYAGSIVASGLTQKPLPAAAAANVSVPLHGTQQYRLINRNRPDGQTMSTGPKVSTPIQSTSPTQPPRLSQSEEIISNILSQYVPWSDGQENPLPSGATSTELQSQEMISNILSQYVPWSAGQETPLLPGPTFPELQSESQLQSEETISNILSQYVPWSDGQDEPLLSGATSSNKEGIDQETSFEEALREAVMDALFKFPRTQSTNSTRLYQRASHRVSPEAPPSSFFDKSREDDTAATRVRQPLLQMFNPTSTATRQAGNFTTPQVTPSPVQEIYQQRSPRSSLSPTTALSNEFGRLSTSQYLTPPPTPSPSRFLFKKPGSDVRHPQSFNPGRSPLLPQPKFNLPQITPSIVQAPPQQPNLDLRLTAVAPNKLPEMMGANPLPTVPSAPVPTSPFAVGRRYPRQPPLPPYRTMPPPIMTTHGSSEVAFPRPRPIIGRSQQAEQKHVSSQTPHLSTAASPDSDENSRTARCRTVPSASQSTGKPTFSQVKAALQQYGAESKRYHKKSFEKMLSLLSLPEDHDRAHPQAYSPAAHGISESGPGTTLPHIPFHTTAASPTERQAGYPTPHLPDTPLYTSDKYQQSAPSTGQSQAVPSATMSTAKSAVLSAVVVLLVQKAREARFTDWLLEKMQSFVNSPDDNDQMNPPETLNPDRTDNRRHQRAANIEEVSPNAHVQPMVAQSEQPRPEDVAVRGAVKAKRNRRRNKIPRLTRQSRSPATATGEAHFLRAIRNLDDFEEEHRLRDLGDRTSEPQSQMRSGPIRILQRPHTAQGHQGSSQKATKSGSLATKEDNTRTDTVISQPPASMDSAPCNLRTREGHVVRASAGTHPNRGDSPSTSTSSSRYTAAHPPNPL